MPTKANPTGGKKIAGMDWKIWAAAGAVGLLIGYFYLRNRGSSPAAATTPGATDTSGGLPAAASSGQPADNTNPAVGLDPNVLSQLALGQADVIGQLGLGSLQLASESTLGALGLAGQVVNQWPYGGSGVPLTPQYSIPSSGGTAQGASGGSSTSYVPAFGSSAPSFTGPWGGQATIPYENQPLLQPQKTYIAPVPQFNQGGPWGI